jgi:hypothetical protein
MTRAEFHRWVAFYEQSPFDDLHRYHRPAALVSHSLGGGDIQQRLDWLQPDPRNADMDDADLNTLRAFGFTGKGA